MNDGENGGDVELSRRISGCYVPSTAIEPLLLRPIGIERPIEFTNRGAVADGPHLIALAFDPSRAARKRCPLHQMGIVVKPLFLFPDVIAGLLPMRGYVVEIADEQIVQVLRL